MKRQKKLKLQRDLKLQLQESMKTVENRKREEENFQKLFDAAIDNEIQMEKSQLSADAVIYLFYFYNIKYLNFNFLLKIRLGREKKLYLDYYEKMKKDRLQEEAAKEKVIYLFVLCAIFIL